MIAAGRGTKDIINKYVPVQLWFEFGFNKLSLLMAAFNTGMLVITMITVKGIYIPLWMLPIAVTLLILTCIIVGYYFDRWGIWKELISRQNRYMNPEFVKLCEDVEKIKKKLEIE
jgi:hypothetical protein